MSTYQYKVVPFIGQMKAKDTAQTVAQQLEGLINSVVQQGWEFYRIDAVQIQVSPGCLASLLGAKATYMNFDQVIFRRPVAGE